MDAQDDDRAVPSLVLGGLSSTDELQAAIAAMTDPISILRPVRGPDGEVTELIYDYVNPAAAALYRIPREAIIGHGHRELFPSVGDPSTWGHYVEALDTGVPVSWVNEVDDSDIMGVFRVAATVFNGELMLFASQDVCDVKSTQRRLCAVIDGLLDPHILLEGTTKVYPLTDTTGTGQGELATTRDVTEQNRSKHDLRGKALPSEVPSGISASSDTFAVEAMLEATRGLLWIASAADAAFLAAELIAALGGTTVSAVTDAASEAIPVDVSFGDGHPLLPAAPRLSVARMLLERYLPAFVRDAQRAVELAAHTSRLAEDASMDVLTGLLNKRSLGRALGRLRAEDTVIMIDLDHFKAVNDTLGHLEGDRLLRALGRTLASTLRATDQACRYGGEEFVVIIPDIGAEAFLTRLQLAWVATRPFPITFSAGIAPAAANPARALEAADRAMYRAKEAGRDQWQWATEGDYG